MMIKIKKNNPFVVFIVVLGLLIFLHSLGALRPLENLLLSLAKPLSSRLYSRGAAFNSSYSEKQQAADLQARVDYLTKEVTRLTVDNSRCQETGEENRKLRDQLKFLNNQSCRTVLANIIAQETIAETSDSGRNFVIDKGTKDGLQAGLGVTSETGVIVGKVVEAGETTAQICLTTSPGCKLAAAVENETKTQGITDGDLGLTIKMNYIPQSEKISPGNIIITSGLGGNIPRGLVIGRVTQVANESNEVWQAATIEPIVNLNNLTVVSVVIP